MNCDLDKSYNSLDRIEKWDPETQKIVKKRIADETGDVLSYEFLTDREGEILELLAGALIPQKRDKSYVKISDTIDRDLAEDRKGVRYGANPWPREFYRKGLADFEEQARKKFGKPVEDFSQSQLENYIAEIFGGKMSDFLRRFLKRVLSDATATYYSHPASWNKIGFPGPAYPEGYFSLDCGEKEDWEPLYKRK
jgi:hypothetical protein